MRSPRRPLGLTPRLLLAQGLVILAGSLTLLLLALLLAPGLFHEHLTRVEVPLADDLRQHVDEAFATATLTALAVAVTAAVLTALAASWLLTRRLVRPIQAMARAAEQIAAGHYGTRVEAGGAPGELDSLASAFDRMAERLAATERTRAEMLRDVAHELRTPLTSLRGYVDALADGVLTLDADTLGTVHGELSRLERLVDDLALVSRAEERRLHLDLRAVSAEGLVATAVRAAAPAFAAAAVDLRSDVQPGLPPVVADSDRLQEVLANLLDNARRHTPSHGVVTVKASSGPGVVELRVTDTGEGIAEEHVHRIFERFYRVDRSRSRGHGGSGIGLAIARALVEAHGGHIRAESRGPGSGATFTVTLPTRVSGTTPDRAVSGRGVGARTRGDTDAARVQGGGPVNRSGLHRQSGSVKRNGATP